jgi:hypothetical protein
MQETLVSTINGNELAVWRYNQIENMYQMISNAAVMLACAFKVIKSARISRH